MAPFWLWELLGRLHPLIVHFPIGLLVVAFFLELLTIRGTKKSLRDGIQMMVGIGAVTALLACLFGWLLTLSGNYGGDTLAYHKWTGIATAGVALLTLFLLRKASRSHRREPWRVYRIVFGLCLVGITVAGHLGASITHGENYLTEVLPWNQQESQAGELLAQYQTVSDTPLEPHQLDKLNLEVRALFAHKCYKCHSTEKSEGDLILDTEDGVFTGGENGPILIAGNAGGSELIRRLKLPKSDEEAMPQKGKALTKDEIALVSLWINQGAHWADEDLKIFPEADMALVKPALPAASDESHPIDQLVDAYFGEHSIRWPAPISDNQYIRRAYLDVIGLLPSPDAVAAFAADTSPDKRERLVQALLDQNHDYAQHWLSFWNDLLRNDYSGTGFITGGRQQITGWLYEALEHNWSYDRMVRALLNPTDASQGFIKGIQWRGFANNSQSIQMQAAQNISQSLLGANLKCASCHNSFVSNISLDQAYGFASIFSDSTMQIYRCDKPTGRMAQPAFLYPELGQINAETVEERLVQLADVIVQPANGRLYRTITNRIWDRLMGRGIIMPVDEMDNPAWNQELLDWLAADFIENGTDLKTLIASIMTSRVYQLPAVAFEEEQQLFATQFQFEGPARKRLSAEQFADAMSQVLGPVYHGVAFNPMGEASEAGWIWHEEREVDRVVLPKPGTRYFRHTFQVPAREIEQAEALITVDHRFALFINGKSVEQGNDWREVHRIDVTNLLQTGANAIAVEGENDGELPNPAGILFSLKIDFIDRQTLEITSSNSWKSTDEMPQEGWIAVAFDDSDWSQARRYAGFQRSHWGQLLEFRHNTAQPQLPFARASLVSLDPFMKALGRPTRENVTTRRDDRATLLQALELTNGEFFNTALQEGAAHWLQKYPAAPEELVNQLYLSALGRAPSSKELQTATRTLGTPINEAALQDLLWALFMLPEFQIY